MHGKFSFNQKTNCVMAFIVATNKDQANSLPFNNLRAFLWEQFLVQILLQHTELSFWGYM